MQLIYVMEIYYGMFGMENEVCDIHVSFTGALKRTPLNYSLWYKIVRDEF